MESDDGVRARGKGARRPMELDIGGGMKRPAAVARAPRVGAGPLLDLARSEQRAARRPRGKAMEARGAGAAHRGGWYASAVGQGNGAIVAARRRARGENEAP
ncbi:hypothetical protein BE17_44050 [Sorangium cellulosum]|uniref:Uncharacterized protein n=1 Tax=Sorangium cellulosum TaxID=56 RepID=A0A150RIL8_SORCE|nr:hypothetical protein BE17_44050 [Sorangium cellulosum]